MHFYQIESVKFIYNSHGQTFLSNYNSTFIQKRCSSFDSLYRIQLTRVSTSECHL